MKFEYLSQVINYVFALLWVSPKLITLTKIDFVQTRFGQAEAMEVEERNAGNISCGNISILPNLTRHHVR